MTIPEYALTVRQPWALAIVAGVKPVENRKKRTHYRGRIAIHAGLTWDKRAARWMRERQIFVSPDPIMGALIGEVTITDCLAPGDAPYSLWSHDELFANDPWKWMLADPVAYPYPIPMKGALGLWETAPKLTEVGS